MNGFESTKLIRDFEEKNQYYGQQNKKTKLNKNMQQQQPQYYPAFQQQQPNQQYPTNYQQNQQGAYQMPQNLGMQNQNMQPPQGLPIVQGMPVAQVMPQNQGMQIQQGMPINLVANPNIQLPRTADNVGYPALIVCPGCNNQVTTITNAQVGDHTWICCIILCLTVGCCCIPFCVDDCQDKIHTCPSCGAYVGKKEYKIC
ncbi:LPS-induced TNF-alpha factor, putative [Ichthyophthirius multifiliis]|uniref:LPS-induced TNF-alpha factor, putative n=1 Tax=Ichthyophthirius multifiliis TaxID=5932 RepID=G0R622_ICHMU|nr:LPS-induced TNF-alpha factor, putative [Ichthyophthirius multifiliis]EGR27088.1 LPS-induced TNF-alpha factor, putative [Ichthyophthirius multifiliis]|eukprot:XP_004023972.1 LPS-induced TNF-alpha factor, putative [Ichthyophthirius multifiliis]